jgi:hypothetical protein
MQPTRCSFPAHVLYTALFICLGTLSDASAQPARGAASDFSSLDRARDIAVVDDAGSETKGRLVRFTPESLTMKMVDGRERVFERPYVATIHAVGDPLKNGMVYGLLVGAPLGIVAGAAVGECGGYEEWRPCTRTEKLYLGAVGGAMLGAMGLGVGAIVDNLIGRRTLLYERPARSRVPAVSIAPSVTLSGARLLLTAAW